MSKAAATPPMIDMELALHLARETSDVAVQAFAGLRQRVGLFFAPAVQAMCRVRGRVVDAAGVLCGVLDSNGLLRARGV